MRQKGSLPLHLRDIDADEKAQWRRMRDAYERIVLTKPQEAPTDDRAEHEKP
jgi:hypothetical protein